MLDIRICVLSPTWDNYQQPQLEYELANAESSYHLDATYTTPKNNDLAGYIWVQVKGKNTHKGGGLPTRYIYIYNY